MNVLLQHKQLAKKNMLLGAILGVGSAALIVAATLMPFRSQLALSATILFGGESVQVRAGRNGQISKFIAEDNQLVSKGQELFELVEPGSHADKIKQDNQSTIKSRSDQISALINDHNRKILEEEKLSEVEKSTIAHQINNARLEVSKQNEEFLIATELTRYAEDNFLMMSKLEADKLISAIELNRARSALASARLNQSQLERSILQNKARLDDLRSQLDRLNASLSLRRTVLSMESNRLDQEYNEKAFSEGYVAYSPIDGIFVKGDFSKGDTVTLGEHIATIRPAGSGVIVIAFVNNNLAKRVKEGSKVIIEPRSIARNSQQVFYGIVSEVAQAPQPHQSEVNGTATKLAYRVSIKLEAERPRLESIGIRHGEIVDIKIITDETSFFIFLTRIILGKRIN